MAQKDNPSIKILQNGELAQWQSARMAYERKLVRFQYSPFLFDISMRNKYQIYDYVNPTF